MELTRSNPYLTFVKSEAHRLAEQQFIADHKQFAEDVHKQRKTIGAAETNVSHKRTSQRIELQELEDRVVRVAIHQDEQQLNRAQSYREPLPFGQSSTPFIAQALSQQGSETEVELLGTSSHVFENAAHAYGSARDLTISILGFQGFKERSI